LLELPLPLQDKQLLLQLGSELQGRSQLLCGADSSLLLLLLVGRRLRTAPGRVCSRLRLLLLLLRLPQPSLLLGPPLELLLLPLQLKLLVVGSCCLQGRCLRGGGV
jgi:hypothetical protein